MAASPNRSEPVSADARPPGRGYDRLAVPRGNGQVEYVTRSDFEKLPLGERVRLLMSGTLKFFRDGQEITAREALRGA
jgi:hypothetical protein